MAPTTNITSLLLNTSYNPSQARISATVLSKSYSYSKTSGVEITPNYL